MYEYIICIYVYEELILIYVAGIGKNNRCNNNNKKKYIYNNKYIL